MCGGDDICIILDELYRMCVDLTQLSSFRRINCFMPNWTKPNWMIKVELGQSTVRRLSMRTWSIQPINRVLLKPNWKFSSNPLNGFQVQQNQYCAKSTPPTTTTLCCKGSIGCILYICCSEDALHGALAKTILTVVFSQQYLRQNKAHSSNKAPHDFPHSTKWGTPQPQCMPIHLNGVLTTRPFKWWGGLKTEWGKTHCSLFNWMGVLHNVVVVHWCRVLGVKTEGEFLCIAYTMPSGEWSEHKSKLALE